MAETKQNNNPPLRSIEVQDIMGKAPNFLISWGITLSFIFVLSILGGSWFFRFPEFVSSPITIITETPSIYLTSKINGSIKEIMVSNNQKVKKGDILAILENNADYKDLLLLKKILAEYTNTNQSFTLPKEISRELILGDLQQPYLIFIKNTNDYSNFLNQNYHTKKINSAAKQIEKLKLYMSSIEKKETQYLTEVQIAQLEQTIAETHLQFQEQKNKLEMEVKNSLSNLKTEIYNWEQLYYFISPIDGKISFTNSSVVNQLTKQGDLIFIVVPENTQKVIGKVNVTPQHAAKVREGQKVTIKLDNYPFMEYGLIDGVVKSVSIVPTNQLYTVEVELPNGLVSNHGKSFAFIQEMSGTAEIITDNSRLFYRLIKPLKSSWKIEIPK